jgi:hypothetical protein
MNKFPHPIPHTKKGAAHFGFALEIVIHCPPQQQSEMLRHQVISCYNQTGRVKKVSATWKSRKTGKSENGQVLILTIFWAVTVWTSSNDVAMSKHGWIALSYYRMRADGSDVL